MPPPTVADLIFSEQANHNFSKTLSELKRHTLSIHNRLRSILEDAAYVQKVYSAFGRPLIANERCGSWYIDPKQKHGSAYFKSTDGHTGVWSFSTRRLNAHLIEVIGKHDGCIIVDSTRRGKRMPDALSKTIPIWCSVVNRALFPGVIGCHGLHTPPHVVATSENAQIASRLEYFLESFLALDIDLPKLRSFVSKPLRPIWITPESHIPTSDVVFDDFHPVICCTASRRVLGGEVSEGGYIQGSGDDTENWAFGLTSAIFWANPELLLSTPEPKLPELITTLVSQALTPQEPSAASLEYIPPTSIFHITTVAKLISQPVNPGSIRILLNTELAPMTAAEASPRELHIDLGPHKIGSRKLRSVLPAVIDFVAKLVAQGELMIKDITIACSTGRDHSVGVGLAVLCLFFDNGGQLKGLREHRGEETIDKLFIRRRLGWIMTAMPHVNPTGATLQSVNSYLIGRPS